ncbi:MAG: AAA family ATPase [Tatlockia sp.]|jgi:hypothetical protein
MDTQTITPNKVPIAIKTREELLKALPEYMTTPTCRRWLLHIDKVPHYTNGKKRGKTDTPQDQQQLVSFNEAYNVLATGGYTGLGFALGADGEEGYWQGIDLDNVWNNSLLIHLQLPGYVELSPSGTGLHAIGFGEKFDTLKDKDSGIEAYCKGRYFTVTGNACNELFGFPVPAQPKDIANFVKQILSPMLGGTVIKPIKDIHKVQLIITPELLVDLKSALQFIPADEERTWIAMGYALRELGDDGFNLWAEWSATSSKHQGDKDLARWDGFKAERTGYPAVFALAKKNGWDNPSRKQQTAKEIFGNQPQFIPPPIHPQIPPLLKTTLGWLEINVADVFTNPPKPPEFLIEELLPTSELTLLSAHGGTGKSMLALQAAVCLATGSSFMGKIAKKCRVLFYSGEDRSELFGIDSNRSAYK